MNDDNEFSAVFKSNYNADNTVSTTLEFSVTILPIVKLKRESLTQLSLHKLWQGEKLNIGLRRQVLIRNTLLTNNCLWIRQDNDDNNNNNEDERMQEETWLDACINDLEKEEEEREQEKQQNIKNESFYNISSHKEEQETMIPITSEHQRQYHDTIKNDSTNWRWQL
ncbi:hypothetical protein BDC45DRAFT_560788 [Circinella umbellata]|nr:hypothetical protein BDC45DRAFT_560788 [Circinella umbellata]